MGEAVCVLGREEIVGEKRVWHFHISCITLGVDGHILGPQIQLVKKNNLEYDIC